MLIYLSSVGVFFIYKYCPYLIGLLFLLVVIIIFIMLANKINSLQQKTQNLTKALSKKDLLLKELNHRVKNNMQMIISLIRLQSYEITDEELLRYLKTLQNRILAMSYLHQLLDKQENLQQIKTALYFQTIADKLQESYSKDIVIKLNIKVDIKTQEAIYCGLIINELVTNSIKYAFNKESENPQVIIEFYKKDNMNYLEVSDNGCGYDTKNNTNSLGLTLVETLAMQQLDGEYKIDTSKGTRVIVKWKHNGED